MPDIQHVQHEPTRGELPEQADQNNERAPRRDLHRHVAGQTERGQ
jgi:hypothetical protein